MTADSIEHGIRETQWPGRFQVLPGSTVSPNMFLTWHITRQGRGLCDRRFRRANGERPLTFIFGAMRDKAIGEMAEILFPMADRVIVTHADNPRSATIEEIRQAASGVSGEIEDAPNMAGRLTIAKTSARPDAVVVITGSIYIVGEAMRLLGVRI